MATTPYMGLTLPVPALTAGNSPTLAASYATLLSGLTGLGGALGTIDSHNHTPGFGAPIPTSALNINANLPMGGYAVTGAGYFSGISNAATLAASVLNAVYSVNGNLYWNNGTGTAVQITSGGSIVGTSGSIGGLTGTAAVNFNSGSNTFFFTGLTSSAALMDVGAVTIHPSNSTTNGVQLLASSSMTSSYTLTLPTALPASTALLQMSSTGQFSATSFANSGNALIGVSASQVPFSAQLDNVTLVLTGTAPTYSIAVGPGGINTAQIASGAVTQGTRAALPSVSSASSGTYSNSTTTYSNVCAATPSLTCTGRWVQIVVSADQSTNLANVAFSAGSTADFQILRDGTTVVATWFVELSTSIGVVPAWTFIDTGATAGTHTYTLQAKGAAVSTTVTVNYVKVYAYEL